MSFDLDISPLVFPATADASMNYHERTGVVVATSTSSADNGNFAAATKNSTFQCSPGGMIPVVDLPRSQATATRRPL